MAAKEVTVSSTQGLTRVVSEVAELLETHREATITAINMAIPSAVNLVELIKHKIKGIHQQNSFERVKDSTKTRVVFKLSLAPLDTTHKGYQPPISESEVVEKSFAEMKKPPPPPANIQRKEGETKEPRDDNRTPGYQRQEWGRNRARRLDRGRRPRGPRGPRADREGGNERTEKFGTQGGPSDTKDFNTTDKGESRPRYQDRGRSRGRRPIRGRRGSRGRYGDRGRGGRNAGEYRERPEYSQRNEPGMEKYQLVRTREENKKQDNEIFVSSAGNPIFFVKDGLLILKKKTSDTIIIKASGQALPKAVRVAEEIKRKEPGLYQVNSFEKRVIKDLYKPREEGLDEVVKERYIEGIEIVLSKKQLDANHPGYQAPISADLVKNLTIEQVEKL
jgi:DNA-binding protein